MTDREMVRAIAEAVPHAAYLNEEGEWCWRSPVFKRFDPLNDLNAIHEAEKILNPGLAYNYAEHLAEVLGIELHIACFQDIYDMLVATPRQRAEAFLKTIGLGKE